MLVLVLSIGAHKVKCGLVRKDLASKLTRGHLNQPVVNTRQSR